MSQYPWKIVWKICILSPGVCHSSGVVMLLILLRQSHTLWLYFLRSLAVKLVCVGHWRFFVTQWKRQQIVTWILTSVLMNVGNWNTLQWKHWELQLSIGSLNTWHSWASGVWILCSWTLAVWLPYSWTFWIGYFLGVGRGDEDVWSSVSHTALRVTDVPEEYCVSLRIRSSHSSHSALIAAGDST